MPLADEQCTATCGGGASLLYFMLHSVREYLALRLGITVTFYL